MKSYRRNEKAGYVRTLTDEEKKTVLDNVSQNVIKVAKNNPNVEFLFFYPPYSIVWWDSLNNAGMVDYYIEAMKILTQETLKYDNIKLFDFCSNYELVCNLTNYKDSMHYNAETNSKALKWMKENEYLITKDNYEIHFEEIRTFYLNYNYDKFFADLDITMEVE